MEKFKIGDKVVFKKEVLDKLNKTGKAESLAGISLDRMYYEYLTRNCQKELKYFEIKRIGNEGNNLDIGLIIGKDLLEHYQGECTCKIITTQKIQNNEIRFQKPKASCKRGTVPAGSTISGRKDKIAISIGHLSYQVCNC